MTPLESSESTGNKIYSSPSESPIPGKCLPSTSPIPEDLIVDVVIVINVIITVVVIKILNHENALELQ